MFLCAGRVSSARTEGVYSRCEGAKGKIALTFDDGPCERYTGEILDILAQYGVKGTFFVIGENAEMYPTLVQREIAECHEVGSHTYSHCNICTCSDTNLTSELYRCENALGEYRPRLFRPPGGKINEHDMEMISGLGYGIVLWSVDTRDWTGISAEKIISTVRENVSDGDIVLFHDYNSRESGTPDALRTLIPELLAKGYELVTVSELIEADS